jgi:subtilase family serine protease
MNQRLKIFGAVFALLAAAACAGHGNVTPPTSGGASTFEWGQSQLQGAAYQGPANAGYLQVQVLVRPQNADGLVRYAQMASDPTSPVYRHFITPQEIGEIYGATQHDYQAAADYFVSQGLTVAGWPQHLALSVAGSQSAMERAFGTKFGTYTKNGIQFIAPTGTPHFAQVVPVLAVSNLVTYNTLHRHFIVPPRANANQGLGYSPQQIRNAFDFTGAYHTTLGGTALDGTGVTVGIIGTGPIDVNRSTWCGDADVASLAALYSVNTANGQLCEVNVTPSAVSAGLTISHISPAPSASPTTNNPSPNPFLFPYSGNFATPPPVTAGGCSNPITGFTTPRNPACNPEDTEAQLDTQQIGTLAPGAHVNFYLAYNTNDCAVYYPNTCVPAPSPSASATPPSGNYGYPAEGLVESDPEIQQAIADNTVDALSLSYGGGETDSVGYAFDSSGNGFNPLEFAALASEGIAVFVSSGDAGATECSSTVACVSYPAGDPSVTSVGGVNAPINEFGQFSGNMTAWGNSNGGNGGSTASNWGGSGGGVSTIFAAPPWQAAALGATHREQPDVSMDADPFTGVTVYTNTHFGASYGPVGGTSVAAPQMAAMWALVVEACKQTPACAAQGSGAHAYRLGNAAPYFYAILKGANEGGTLHSGFTPALPYANVFYDVVYGENTMYTASGYVTGAKAGPGYDEVTGVGVPFAGHLIQAITGSTVP